MLALVKFHDNLNPALSSDKQLSGLWKRGDIVIVKPDDWKWGREERKALIIISLPSDWSEAQCGCIRHSIMVSGIRSDSVVGDSISQELICRSRFSIDIEVVLDRCYDEQSGLSGQELEDVKTFARQRMHDLEDDFQPLMGFSVKENEIYDKAQLPELDDLMRKAHLTLATEHFHSITTEMGTPPVEAIAPSTTMSAPQTRTL